MRDRFQAQLTLGVFKRALPVYQRQVNDSYRLHASTGSTGRPRAAKSSYSPFKFVLPSALPRSRPRPARRRRTANAKASADSPDWYQVLVVGLDNGRADVSRLRGVRPSDDRARRDALAGYTRCTAGVSAARCCRLQSSISVSLAGTRT